MDLYGSYDQFLGGGDLYSSYDAMNGGYGATYMGGMGGGYGGYGNMPGYGGMGGGYGMGPQGFGGFNNNVRQVQDIRGVGIAFGKAPMDSHASVAIRRIYPNSSADRSRGILRKGDVLMSVNGVNVTQHSIGQLRSVIPGPAGTPVRLGFIRHGYKRYEVDLIRDYKGAFNSGMVPQAAAPPPRPMMRPPMFYYEPQPQYVSYVQPSVSYVSSPMVMASQPIYTQETTSYQAQAAPIEVKGTQV